MGRGKSASSDFSFGTPAHPIVTKDFLSGYRLAKPFLVKQGGFSADEFDQLYHQAEMEAQSSAFHALWYFLSAWGRKPGNHSPRVKHE